MPRRAINVNFTSSSSEGVVWDLERPNVVLITHNLNCYPIVRVYDNERNQVKPVVVVLSGTTFELDFSSTKQVGENENWLCTICYGAEYSVPIEESVSE